MSFWAAATVQVRDDGHLIKDGMSRSWEVIRSCVYFEDRIVSANILNIEYKEKK